MAYRDDLDPQSSLISLLLLIEILILQCLHELSVLLLR